MRASELAALVEGRLEGDTDPVIRGVSPLDLAGIDELSFLASARYLPYFRATKAGAVLLGEENSGEAGYTGARIIVRDVHRSLARILGHLYPEPPPNEGVHPTAIIAEDVELGAGVGIGPYAVVGTGVRLGARVQIGAHCVVGEDCELADGVVLHPHVTLYRGVRIGERSIIHSGTRLGVDGFGYVPVDGAHRKVPQVGACIIGADVEIGANSTIDRGSVGHTEIGDNVKIDNMVHVGHNVRIGPRSLIVAQVGIAGSAEIGSGVTLGGQVGVAGHLTIGDGAIVAAQAGVFGDLAGGSIYSGYPARPHKESLRAQAGLFRLPRLMQRIQRLERALFSRGTPEE